MVISQELASLPKTITTPFWARVRTHFLTDQPNEVLHKGPLNYVQSLSQSKRWCHSFNLNSYLQGNISKV